MIESHQHTTDCTCRDVAEMLALYLDGELAVPVRAAVDRHLAECPDCVRYVRSYRQTIEMAAAAFGEARVDASEVMPQRLVEAIRKALHESA